MRLATLALTLLTGPALGQSMPSSMPGMQMPAPSPSTAPAPQPAAPAIHISSAWARATAPGQTEAAAYLTLTSLQGDRLIGIDTSEAGMAMLHSMVKKNGIAEMRDLDAITLPAGKPVHLAPGGVHIMLMDLKSPLKPGDTLHLSLSFAHAGRQDIAVPVKPIGASGP